MKLTERERTLIARRAAGEYACIPTVERIVRDHRKNRNPDDQVFLEFGRLILKKSYSWDDYERLGKAVLKIIPEPFGTPWWKKKKKTVKETPAAKRVVKCGICSDEGHNARTCPDKPNTPTVKHSDGITRLTPGYDPNPDAPSRVEDYKPPRVRLKKPLGLPPRRSEDVA